MMSGQVPGAAGNVFSDISAKVDAAFGGRSKAASGPSADAEDEATSSSSSSSSRKSLQLLLLDLLLMVESGLLATKADDSKERQMLSDLRLLVLPDMATLLLESLDPAAAAAAGCLPTAARQAVQWTVAGDVPALPHGLNSSSSSCSGGGVAGVSEQLVVSLLQQGLVPPAPGSTPQPIQQPLDSFVAALGGIR
jgi:hypothetical protein